MLMVSFASWWYGTGWRMAAGRAKYKVARLGEFFSILQLLKTLFSPYRQISAGAVGGPLNIRLRAFFDRLFSRFVGFFVRLVMVMVGLVVMVVSGAIAVVWLVTWPLLPLSPLIFIIFAAQGIGA